MRKLKITIDASAKEIADLVLALQDRQKIKVEDAAKTIAEKVYSSSTFRTFDKKEHKMKYRRYYQFGVVFYDNEERRLRMDVMVAEDEAQVRADYAECLRERDWILLAVVRSPERPSLEKVEEDEKNP